MREDGLHRTDDTIHLVIDLSAAKTPRGEAFKKFAAMFCEVSSYEELNEGACRWLHDQGYGQYESTLKLILGLLPKRDAAMMKKLDTLIKVDDPDSWHNDFSAQLQLEQRKRIEEFAPFPATKIFGQDLALAPDAKASVFERAIKDIGDDVVSAERYLGLTALIYISKKDAAYIKQRAQSPENIRRMKSLISETLKDLEKVLTLSESEADIDAFTFPPGTTPSRSKHENNDII